MESLVEMLVYPEVLITLGVTKEDSVRLELGQTVIIALQDLT